MVTRTPPPLGLNEATIPHPPPRGRAARRRVALVVGPTDGHVYPALAIAAAWRAACPDLDLRVFGAEAGPARRLLAAHDIALDAVAAAPLASVGVARRLAALLPVLRGIGQARRRLRAHGTRLVLGLGGYASGVVLAARTLGLATAIHEANVELGLANRLLAPIVHRVLVGMPAAAGSLGARRAVFTGTPVRAAIADLARERRTAPARGRAARVLVTGGSGGGNFLARVVPPLLALLGRHGVAAEALHLAGGAASLASAAYRAAGVPATVEERREDMAGAYRWADLAIARGGAGTLAELAAAGLPSLLVPLARAARDHQVANARAFAAAGAGLWVLESAWEPEGLAARLAALLRDEPAWAAASAAARGMAVPDAARRVVEACEALGAGRW